MNSCLLSFVLSALSCSLAAQRTIVVDAAGGAGHHYKSLAAAVTAAKDGDILLVRPGIYQWIKTQLTKGVTVQGSGATTTGIFGSVSVSNLPARSSFTLKDVSGLAAVRVLSCKGNVLLDGVRFPTQMYARASHRITLRNSEFPTARFEGCTVQIDGGRLLGTGYVSRKAATLEALDSIVDITNAAVIGSSFTVVHPNKTGSTPAIRATRSHIRVRGRLANLQAVRPLATTYFAPALEGDASSSLTIDPIVKVVQPYPSAPLITGFGRGITRKALPTLHAPANPELGKLWTYSIESKPSDVFAISVGLPIAPLPFLGDFLHLQPQSLIVLNVGQQPASGRSSFTIRHTSLTKYRGHVFTLQAAAGAGPQLTNAVAISVR
jgi:hypothetical protein